MASFTGSVLTVSWIYSSGTIDMNTDYRSFAYTPSVEYYDETAGADLNHQRIPGYKDGQAKFGGLLQSGSLPTWATALIEGALGTLVWCPEGTAAGKYHGTAAFRSGGLQQQYVYNGLVEVTIDFQQNGARSEGTIS